MSFARHSHSEDEKIDDVSKEKTRDWQFCFSRDDIDQLPVNPNGKMGTPRFLTFVAPDHDESQELSKSTLQKDLERSTLINGLTVSSSKFLKYGTSTEGLLLAIRDAEHTYREQLSPDEQLSSTDHEFSKDVLLNIRAAYSQSPAGLLWTVACSQLHINGDYMVFEPPKDREHNIVFERQDGEERVYLYVNTSIAYINVSNVEAAAKAVSYPFLMQFKMCERDVASVDDPKINVRTWGFELESIKTNSPVIAEICKGRGGELLSWHLQRKALIQKVDEQSKLFLKSDDEKNELPDEYSAGQGIGLDILKNHLVSLGSPVSLDEEGIVSEIKTPEQIFDCWLTEWSQFKNAEIKGEREILPKELLLYFIKYEPWLAHVRSLASSALTSAYSAVSYAMTDPKGALSSLSSALMHVPTLFAPVKDEPAPSPSEWKFLCEMFGKDLMERKLKEAKKIIDVDLSYKHSGMLLIEPPSNSRMGGP